MIDHIALAVSDLKKSQPFYDTALAPLGYKKLMEKPQENGQGILIFGWEDANQTDIWIREGRRNEPRLHIAFRANTREQVDAFYRAALTANGKDNGKPSLRPQYHENYYSAFVLDPDGNNIEAVCHTGSP
jgi:catechol 2,3-dioxygenase-like lactoylglutathione lyase family enzyme